ncbi:hypothetical protein ACOMHN_015807 [Nucella lapillus]
MDTESHPRPRRTRHDSSKLYDRERKDLELAEVLDVLQRYVDYGGGINCCVCGKLYKSRVCFIKHLWEHTIYWDLFAGDKNHMRVLSIQAALILYGTCQQPLGHIPVDNLLVTSPHSTDNADAKPFPALPFTDLASSPSPAVMTDSSQMSPPCHRESAGILSLHDAEKLLPTTPMKQVTSSARVPNTPRKKKAGGGVRASLKRKTPPPKLELRIPAEKEYTPVVVPEPLTRDMSSPSPLVTSQDSVFCTPVKQKIPFVVPRTPRKTKKFAGAAALQNRQARRCLLPTADMADPRQVPHWKNTDSSACKRKSAVRGGCTAVVSAVRGGCTAVVSAVRGGCTAVVSAVRGGCTAVVSTVVSAVVSAVRGGFTAVVSAVRGGFTAVVSAVRGGFTAVVSAVRGG